MEELLLFECIGFSIVILVVLYIRYIEKDKKQKSLERVQKKIKDEEEKNLKMKLILAIIITFILDIIFYILYFKNTFGYKAYGFASVTNHTLGTIFGVLAVIDFLLFIRTYNVAC